MIYYSEKSHPVLRTPYMEWIQAFSFLKKSGEPLWKFNFAPFFGSYFVLCETDDLEKLARNDFLFPFLKLIAASCFPGSWSSIFGISLKPSP